MSADEKPGATSAGTGVPATSADAKNTGQKEPPEPGAAVTRRRFLTLLFAAATALGLGALAAPLARFAYPVLEGEVSERLKIAVVGAVPAVGIRFEYQEIPSMLIQLADGGYAAYSLVCTHLGCIVGWEPPLRNFHCPCHAGYFDENGEVVSGPPPRPLTRYALTIEGTDIFVEGPQ